MAGVLSPATSYPYNFSRVKGYRNHLLMKPDRKFILILGPHFMGDERNQIEKAARLFHFKNYTIDKLEPKAGMDRILIKDGARRDDLREC